MMLHSSHPHPASAPLSGLGTNSAIDITRANSGTTGWIANTQNCDPIALMVTGDCVTQDKVHYLPEGVTTGPPGAGNTYHPETGALTTANGEVYIPTNLDIGMFDQTDDIPDGTMAGQVKRSGQLIAGIDNMVIYAAGGLLALMILLPTIQGGGRRR